MENYLLWGSPHWSRGRPHLPEQQEKCDELTITPITCVPVPLWGGGRVEKEGEVEGMCFKVCFYFPLSYSDLF